MDDLTVVVATYGDPAWSRLAVERAVPSAERQAPTVHVHLDDGTLADARNRALESVHTRWVCTLDADDELEPGYVGHMARAAGDLRVPSVRYVRPGWPAGRPRMPKVFGHQHRCVGGCLPEGNWLVVGTVAPVDLIRRVGGWREWPLYEDWDLWLRCWQAGATVETVPAAVYRAHCRPDSRNRAPSPAARLDAHRAIAVDLGVPAP